MKWSHVDLEKRVWTIPSTKTDKEHRVPLSDAAVKLLKGMQQLELGDRDIVFPGMKAGKSLSNMAMLQTLRRMGRGDVTAHGFRSTFSDWAAEQTSFASEVREMALAHTVSDKVEAAYRRGDLFEKRRQLAEAWAAYIDSPTPIGKIVPIRTISTLE